MRYSYSHEHSYKSRDSSSARQPCLPRELVASTAFLLARLGVALKMRAIKDVRAGRASARTTTACWRCSTKARARRRRRSQTRCKLDRSQLVGLLDTLEERGLIERRARSRTTAAATSSASRPPGSASSPASARSSRGSRTSSWRRSTRRAAPRSTRLLLRARRQRRCAIRPGDRSARPHAGDPGAGAGTLDGQLPASSHESSAGVSASEAAPRSSSRCASERVPASASTRDGCRST